MHTAAANVKKTNESVSKLLHSSRPRLRISTCKLAYVICHNNIIPFFGALLAYLPSGAGTFFGQGGLKIVRSCQRLGGFAPQTPLFSNARFYQQDTQQTYFDRHQLHARSSDRNFFRIIFYRGKQDCLLPLGFSNHARITTHVFVKCKYLNDKTKKPH